MNTSRWRGHPIEELPDGSWVFSDTQGPVSAWPDRPCSHCGCGNTPEGHDACLGTLPGVMNACCGHGELDEAYVQYADGSCVRGRAAFEEQR